MTNSTTMLFLFASKGAYPFWMEGVNSSLDIIWLSMTGRVGRVVYQVKDIQPCGIGSCPSYTPASNAEWVLETKGGFSSSYGVAVRTTIAFN